MLKQSFTGFAKFGFYISLIEMPLESVLGKVSTAGMFVSGGLASLILDHKKTLIGNVWRFLGNGLMICVLGSFLNKPKFND